MLPASGLSAVDLAVIVNEQDPLSIKIADYYQRKRGVPEANILHISFKPQQPSMRPGEFAVLEKIVESKIPDHIQAYALTWAAPYRVGCMSISSAFALGYDIKYCAKGCKPTATNLYANSNSARPYADFSIRPTMLLAAENFAQAKRLIDRGVAADGVAVTDSGLRGAAYLVETPDKNRSVRKVFFPAIKNSFGERLPVEIQQSKTLEGKLDVMFYFTGAAHVRDIDTNVYLPGAMADHLTSTGGQLTNSSQMSALRWLEAGATGSYGTVVEPCNLLSKFPNPFVALSKYTQGASLIEAYWKSVQTPGQGVFIGEPLAKPYRGYRLQLDGGSFKLSSPVLTPGHYAVWVADTREGPFRLLRSGVAITAFQSSIRLSPPYSAFYKIERLEVFGQLPIPHLLQ
ncbi:MAG: TIGR03790 family protein [Pseudomonadales bacterium]